ncbi:MAG: hypothetical protein ACYTG3_01790 [Planctomycetota bacterium]
MRRSAALLIALLLAPLAPAQDNEPPAKIDAEDLAKEQEKVGRRLAKIEETMRRITKILEARNPDQAARLKIAWQRSKDDRNLERIKEIEDLLKEEYFNRALDQQKELAKALGRLLDILLDRDAERKDLQDQIKGMEDALKDLNTIIEEERDQYHESEPYANPEKALQRAAAAKAKLANLINRQGKLIEKTKTPQADTDLGSLRKRLDKLLKDQKALRGKKDPAGQAELAKRTEALAEDIKKHAQGLPDALKAAAIGRRNPVDQAAAATDRAAGGMAQAAQGMQKGGDVSGAQQGAEQDLREAQDALRRLGEKKLKHQEKKLSDDQARIRKDTGRLQKDLDRLQKSAPGEQAGGDALNRAQNDMQKAENKLDKSRRQDAVPHEENAKKELEDAYKKLEEFEKALKKLIKLPDYDKMAKKQDKTAEKTDDLLKKMKKQGGGQQGDAQGGTPGQQGVEGAKKAMQRASRNLRGKSARRANKDQKEALERLEKAREELEEALRQLREEEQLMLLEALERRLVRMLQQQTKIHKETLSLNIRLREAQKAAKKAPRAVVDKGQQLGNGEAELSVAAEKILEILREEGTTVVIPDVMEDMRKDLDTLAKRLRKLDAGEYTQQIQQDVIETLRELIEVIKEELERRQGRGQPGNDGSESDPDESLLPTSAELKMLKSLQVRVNKRTSTFDRMRRKEEPDRLRIAEKQEAVGTLTRTMADRLNREEDE